MYLLGPTVPRCSVDCADLTEAPPPQFEICVWREPIGPWWVLLLFDLSRHVRSLVSVLIRNNRTESFGTHDKSFLTAIITCICR